MQRNKDKSTLVQPRMRKFQSCLMDFKIVHEQDIQVQRPGAIRNSIQTVPPKILFDGQQFLEQGVRL